MTKIAISKIFLTFFFLISMNLTNVRAQEILAGFGGGIGTFKMASAKEFNQTMINSNPFGAELTDNFPPWFFYKAELLYCLPKVLAIGLSVSSTSTGSRAAISDYSGRYTFDNVQKGIFPGIKIVLGKSPGKTDGLNFSLEGGFSESRMKLEETVKVQTETASDKMNFNASGFYVQPGLCYFKSIISTVKLCGTASYLFGFDDNYLSSQTEMQIIDYRTSKALKPQWDGLRIGITAFIGL